MLNLTYCLSDDMATDILTKALPKWKAITHTLTLGLRPVTHEGEWRILDLPQVEMAGCESDRTARRDHASDS